MKKQQYQKLKFHTIFSVSISLLFLIILLIDHSITLGIAMIFLASYVIGNGIIHIRHNELKRDTVLEYIIVAIIALVLLVGVLYRS
jgi:hypothetical protein